MSSRFEQEVVGEARFDQLLALVSALATALEPQAAAERAAEALLAPFQADRCLLLYRRRAGVERRQAPWGFVYRLQAGADEAPIRQQEAFTMATWVATHGQAFSPALGSEPAEWPSWPAADVEGMVCMPMAGAGGRLLGAVYLDRRVEAFSEEEERALAAFVCVVSQAIERSLAGVAVQERLQNYDMLSRVYAALTQNLELEKVLDTALQTAMELIRAERALILLLEDGQLRVAAGRNLEGPLAPGAELEVSRSACQKALESQQGVFVLDTHGDDEFASRFSVRDLRLQSVIAVPLMGQTGTIGVFYVDARTEMAQALEQERFVLRAIASQAGILIENARLFRQATVDGLTGLYIRSYFMNRLEEETRRVARYGGRLSLLVIDLDHFKRLNDTHGHQTGDLALQQVAKVVVESLRAGIDLAGRFGGEELLVMLPSTDAPGALVVAERIRRRIQELGLESPLGERVTVTASIGVASLPEVASSASDLFARADEALYASKHAGRNRVTVNRPEGR